MPTTALDVLGRTPYARLTTFRRSGEGVHTPVWITRQGSRLLIWTNGSSGKVKRVRRHPGVLLAPCTRTGSPLGEPVEGDAEVFDGDTVRTVERLLRDKYASAPILLPFTHLMARLNGNTHIAIAVVLR